MFDGTLLINISPVINQTLLPTDFLITFQRRSLYKYNHSSTIKDNLIDGSVYRC